MQEQSRAERAHTTSTRALWMLVVCSLQHGSPLRPAICFKASPNRFSEVWRRWESQDSSGPAEPRNLQHLLWITLLYDKDDTPFKKNKHLGRMGVFLFILTSSRRSSGRLIRIDPSMQSSIIWAPFPSPDGPNSNGSVSMWSKESIS